MTFPIWVQPHAGRFQAYVLGSPAMAADGATKEEALAALRSNINQHLASGELVLLDVPYRAVTDFAGLFEDDPTLEEMVKDIYRERDAQVAAEFPRMNAFDTDVLSDILRGAGAVARATGIDRAQQAVPAVVAEEMIRGRFVAIRQAEAGKGKATLPQAYELFEQTFRALAAFQILPYTDAAERLVEAFQRRKIRVGTRDMRIAAICIIHGATLVTRNARDYAQLPGLTFDVWK